MHSAAVISASFRTLIALVVLVGIFVPLGRSLGGPTAALAETKSEHDARMAWWREAKFGMFIHWGIYAVPAGEYQGQNYPRAGEWIMEWANIPRKDYEKFAQQFNPVKFDAAEWVAIAKNAGMKYIVITSKHHDGFSMFDSRVSDYTVVKSTPYKKDPLKDLSRECKKAGLKFCVYHSIMDWHHPAQLKSEKDNHHYNFSRMAPGRKDEYVTYMKGQLRELIENYDPAVLWFDGEWCEWWTEPDARDLVEYLHSLKPDLIINNRVGTGRKGNQGYSREGTVAADFFTPEQEIPATGFPGKDWESCMTMNGSWGYHQHDNHWKSPTVLIQNLVDIASKGGNFLLNVGPKADGTIPEASVERLAAIGKWMKVNGESIHGTTASPFAKLAWGRATQKPGKIYLHVFHWPDGRLEVPGLKNKVTKAYFLSDASQATLEIATANGQTIVRLPPKAPDPIDSVVVLQIEGSPQVEAQAAR